MPQCVRVTKNQSKLFGPPPILPGEDPVLYQRLLDDTLAAVEPRDMIERMMAIECANETWANVRRISWAKEGCVEARLISRLDEIIRTKTSLSAAERKALLRGWRANQRAAVEKVEEILSAANLTYQALVTKCVQEELDSIERLDRLLSIGQARRAALLRTIENRRAAIACQSHACPQDHGRTETRAKAQSS